MELKTKYQYTYFIYPYMVDETKYDKYILKLLKDNKCTFKIFQKERDLDVYNYFLPEIRKYYFPTFDLRGEELKRVEVPKMNEEIIVADGRILINFEAAADCWISTVIATDRLLSVRDSLWR